MVIQNQMPDTGGTKDFPLRILHVIHGMEPGGAQALVMNIYRHIDRSQVQFDFAVRSHQPEYYDEEINTLGGRLFRVPWISDNPLSIFRYVRSFEALLREKGPFAGLHSHVGVFSGHVLPLGKDAGIPLRIAHGHSASLSKSSILRKSWAIIMRKRIRASATHLLACSQTAAEWLYGPHWRRDSRTSLIPNAIDITAYEGIHDNRGELRRRLELPLDGPLVGHIGRFESVKNHAFLLEVFSAFLEICPAAKLILIGEGTLHGKIQRQAIENGIERAVYFLGVRSDIPQILGSLDLFVLPSLYEGLGIALIEAQAAGVPCLVSKTVPLEADLGLDLVQFEDLEAGIGEWVRSMLKLKEKKAPAWEKRKATLQNADYDIQDTVHRLYQLYLSTQ